MYKLIDQSYFDGSLNKLVNEQIGHGSISFEVADVGDLWRGTSAQAVTFPEYDRKSGRYKSVIIRFYRSFWGRESRNRRTDGIQAKFKLEAMIVTMCHELTHALIFLLCQIPANHDETFLRLNQTIWGHSLSKYRYRNRDDPKNVICIYD